MNNVATYIMQNNYKKLNHDPTYKYLRRIKDTKRKLTDIIRLIETNITAPKLKGLIKVHKPEDTNQTDQLPLVH